MPTMPTQLIDATNANGLIPTVVESMLVDSSSEGANVKQTRDISDRMDAAIWRESEHESWPKQFTKVDNQSSNNRYSIEDNQPLTFINEQDYYEEEPDICLADIEEEYMNFDLQTAEESDIDDVQFQIDTWAPVSPPSSHVETTESSNEIKHFNSILQSRPSQIDAQIEDDLETARFVFTTTLDKRRALKRRKGGTEDLRKVIFIENMLNKSRDEYLKVLDLIETPTDGDYDNSDDTDDEAEQENNTSDIVKILDEPTMHSIVNDIDSQESTNLEKEVFEDEDVFNLHTNSDEAITSINQEVSKNRDITQITSVISQGHNEPQNDTFDSSINQFKTNDSIIANKMLKRKSSLETSSETSSLKCYIVVDELASEAKEDREDSHSSFENDDDSGKKDNTILMGSDRYCTEKLSDIECLCFINSKKDDALLTLHK
ncbi:unnamed protein product [Owenia fusiformis]|uniref:Uncharacterized protein n=1 Tax=Owenia fusiformis TaxID=6347 RepID=A0A8J1UC68_OWEFU|nr:unnamed protein product [Owenia fusiformis]